MSRYIDFDLFRKEVAQEPLVIKIFDKKYELPSALPASVMVRILHLQAECGGELPPHEIVFMAEKFLGKDMMVELLDRQDFSMEVLGEMIKRVVEAYSGGAIPHEEQKTVTVDPMKKG